MWRASEHSVTTWFRWDMSIKNIVWFRKWNFKKKLQLCLVTGDCRYLIYRVLRAVSWLRQLVASLSLQRSRFGPRPLYMGFMVVKMTLGQTFLKVFTYLFIFLFIYLLFLFCSFILLFSHLVPHSCMYLFTYLFIYLFVYFLIYLFTFFVLFIYSFI